jgi:hypothetical protein
MALEVGKIEQLNNKPAQPERFPSHVAGTCGKCARLEAEIADLEGALRYASTALTQSRQELRQSSAVYAERDRWELACHKHQDEQEALEAEITRLRSEQKGMIRADVLQRWYRRNLKWEDSTLINDLLSILASRSSRREGE